MSVHPGIIISRLARDGHVAIARCLELLDRGDLETLRSTLVNEERRLREIDAARMKGRQ